MTGGERPPRPGEKATVEVRGVRGHSRLAALAGAVTRVTAGRPVKPLPRWPKDGGIGDHSAVGQLEVIGGIVIVVPTKAASAVAVNVGDLDRNVAA